MSATAASTLRRLTTVVRRYGGLSSTKLELLVGLERQELSTARQVLHLHELLCYLRAYPDDAVVLEQTERMLDRFGRRRDLRSFRDELEDTGIAGTPIRYRFFWPMARWLAERWPGRLRLEWDEPESAERIGWILPQLVNRATAEALKQTRWTAKTTLLRLRPSKETDAAFLIRRIEAMPGDDFTREAIHDSTEAVYRLGPGVGGPSRTAARYDRSPVVFIRRELPRGRPDLGEAILRKPRRVRPVSRAAGRKLIDLAMEAMVTRSRDLEAFGYGNPGDVRVVDDSSGLQFACIGVTCERRSLLHTMHGYLTLRNGVPIGYVQTDSLFHSCAVSYNTFDTFRGGEAAQVFGRILATTHRLFGAKRFSIEPYQLGQGNAEGIASGAWWFYYKLGFRPRDRAVRRLAREELDRMKRRPGHRSSRKTLRALAAAHLFWSSDSGLSIPPPPWNIALSLLPSSPDRALSKEAAALLGVRAFNRWSAGERSAWRRWAPWVPGLPGIAEWTRSQRSALTRIIRAKGAPTEDEFLRLTNRHSQLRRSLVELARRGTSISGAA